MDRSHHHPRAHVILLAFMDGCACDWQPRRASKHPRSRRVHARVGDKLIGVQVKCRDGDTSSRNVVIDTGNITCPTGRRTPFRSALRSTQRPYQQLRTAITIAVALVVTSGSCVVAYGDLSRAERDAAGDGGGEAVRHSTSTDESTRPTIMVVVGQGDSKSGRNTPVAADHGLRLRILAESIVNVTFRHPTGIVCRNFACFREIHYVSHGVSSDFSVSFALDICSTLFSEPYGEISWQPSKFQ